MHKLQHHDESTVMLAHDHSMYGLAARRRQGETAVFERQVAPRFRQGGVNAVGWVMGGDPPFFGIETADPWQGTQELLGMIWQEAEESSDSLAICLQYADIERAIAADKIAVILTLEGAALLDGGSDSIDRLQQLYDQGIRSLQLVGQGWNRLIEAPAAHPHPSQGLAKLGKDVVREMNRLGMLTDLSHIPDPDPLVQDILAIGAGPLIDSHRGVRGVTDVARNISDERVRAIAETNGVVGLQFFSVTLAGEQKERATVDDLIRHIDYLVDLVGIDHVALGPDFLDARLIQRKPGHFVEGIEGVTQLPRVTDVLLHRGYSESEIRQILGGNLLRVYKHVMR